jgi:hypothetical protein
MSCKAAIASEHYLDITTASPVCRPVLWDAVALDQHLVVTRRAVPHEGRIAPMHSERTQTMDLRYHVPP